MTAEHWFGVAFAYFCAGVVAAAALCGNTPERWLAALLFWPVLVTKRALSAAVEMWREP